jgi:hypothetical protein
MKYTIKFEEKHQERLKKAFDGDESIEKQIQNLVLVHIGQKAMNIVGKEEQEVHDAKVKKLEEEKQERIRKKAQKIAAELGI